MSLGAGAFARAGRFRNAGAFGLAGGVPPGCPAGPAHVGPSQPPSLRPRRRGQGRNRAKSAGRSLLWPCRSRG
eukprot:2657909-Alexandrium_andersonii.AAC.1